MVKENSFKLKFGSLSTGHHSFNMKLSDESFSLREESLIENGVVDVLLNVEKAERHLMVSYGLKGVVRKKCDVCLSELDYPVLYDSVLHVKLTDKSMEDEVDILYLPASAVEVDLESYLYDSLVLSLPMKFKCVDSINREDCDTQVLKILNATKDTSVNEHPEWQKLKNLFNKS